ncbi:hypothetical protein [Pseudotabrizicola algicola]|uniref:Capsular biosynthesis protein n=1 Tax=Pseudotabrizicola algicola TaxID=2709381 RepID=A0A6B3RRG6_9RHOB|nr:hypothetical protein [Pseudotabrizicola algicola]NEX47883.1 hypothetical protein [Pseudotabrizicola algicola]
MAQARVVFHLPARHLKDWRETRYLKLFARIEEAFAPLGARISVCDRRTRPFQAGTTDAYDDGDLHILDTGRARGRGVLNASIAYLPPFWHLDPAGMQAESSIGAQVFDPSEVPQRAANGFFERMRERYTLARRSRRAQEEEAASFAPGAISVFLQGSQPEENGLAHVSGEAMLRAVARGAGGRQVLVKPHPLAPEHDAAVIARVIAEGCSITPTTANVHDMIAASVATVSINSACAIEGFLQHKPAILFGPSDFHHVAQTVRQPEGFSAALGNALALPQPDYRRFLYWYFVRNCLNVGAPDFAAKVQAIFAQAGFPPERLGLRAPVI